MISIHMGKGVLLYCCAVAALLGASFGSFLNCAAWRTAHAEPWWKGRSRCPACGHTLGAGDLFPVLSWLLLGGKCRYCGDRISVRYPLTELFFALVTVGCLLRFDLTVLCLRNWIFLCCLFCLSLVDWEAYLIPDGCLVVVAGAWLAALPFVGGGRAAVWRSLGAGLAFGGGLLAVSLVLDRLLKRESLGGGDIKLFAVVGLYLGWVGTLFTLLLSCVLGLALGLARRERDGHIPFGPAIAGAAGLMLLCGGGLVNWYLGLLGLA